MRGSVLLVLVVALAACASGSAGTSPETALTVRYWEDGIEQKADPIVWTLRCNPAGGSLPRRGVACRRLAEDGRKLFTPVASGTVCTQIYGGPQIARIIGRVEGKRVWATISRENGCQISRWNGLSPWLIPAGGVRS